MEKLPFCECGCGGEVSKPGNRFIKGHVMKGRHPPNWIPRELRTCIYEKCDIVFECKVNSTQRYCSTGCVGKDPAVGCIWTEERREHLRRINTGKHHSEEAKEKVRKANIGKKNPEHSERMKLLWQDPEYVAKQMKANNVQQNKLEKCLGTILQKLFPNQWKFVGDGRFKKYILGGGCPDFVHVDQKKIIELFGGWWHGEERTGVPNEQHGQERVDLFAKFGYQTLIIWEYELRGRRLLEKKLQNFH